MNTTSPIILIGIGGAGANIVRGITRAFGSEIRHLLADTDATTGQGSDPFVLLGGDRLSGRGAGGDTVSARLAAEESVQMLDEHLEGARLAVIVTGLGGGTGGGASLEVVKHLRNRGIPTIIFATMPFEFEGKDKQRNAYGMRAMIEDEANTSFFMPLDQLVDGIDNMTEALHRAVDLMASTVTFFWRLIEKPGYIRLDIERIRHLMSNSGRGRFAIASVQGAGRAKAAADQLIRSEMLMSGKAPVSSILIGVLAGDDLRLNELSVISSTFRTAFGESPRFELATVNDEATFCGRMVVVAMLFESSGDETANGETRNRSRSHDSILSTAPAGRGRFDKVVPTIWHDEDLDTPTYIRKNIALDF